MGQFCGYAGRYELICFTAYLSTYIRIYSFNHHFMNTASKYNSTSTNWLSCGVGLTGRVDKKFCSPFCKSQYNNHKRNIDEGLVLRINKALRKNRSILLELYGAGHTVTNKDALQQMGFNFQYCTQRIVEPVKGIDHYFCYEWRYTINYIGGVQIVFNENV